MPVIDFYSTKGSPANAKLAAGYLASLDSDTHAPTAPKPAARALATLGRSRNRICHFFCRGETSMSDPAEELRQFQIQEVMTGYWRIVFSNPPINLLNSRTVIELAKLVSRIECAQDLRVVVFASDHPDFFMAR